MAYFPEPVARLIEALQRLPGIGPKTAQRLSFFLLKRPADEVGELATALTELKTRIVHCSRCWNVFGAPQQNRKTPTYGRSANCVLSRDSPDCCATTPHRVAKTANWAPPAA